MSQTADSPSRADFLGFELVTGHPPAEGSECAIQTLYEGEPKCTCCKNWVDAYPADLAAQPEAQPETKQKAVVVRMRRNHSTLDKHSTGGGGGGEDTKPLVLDSVVVQSESLKRTLGDVFDGYRGITASLRRLVFRAPFHPFHYRWQRFGRILERQTVEDPVAAGYSQILYDLLRSELDYAMSEIKDMTDHGVITYAKLWALFEPGEHVVAARDEQRQVFVVEGSEYDSRNKEPCLVVKARKIDWDGEKLGYVTKELKINRFTGTRSISELWVCPLALHPEREAIKARAIERGSKFRELCGVHHKSYSGNVKYKARSSLVIRKVDGRMMVDAAAYLRENTSEKQDLIPLDIGSMMPELEIGDDNHEQKKLGTQQKNDSLDGAAGGADQDGVGANLTDQELMLCNGVVRGYSLKLNRWAKFQVDNVREVSWNEVAFSGLMLPDGYKDLLLSFVEEPDQLGFDDIIEGKGLGTIVLLAGNPGTGKTLTAEAVADHVRRPLYSLNVGELGQRASSVENKLQSVLELTEKWNAILLFDECDVFMQKRTTENLKHNEIVAVALRILEYYRGILFMTSNRSQMIDRAFESRIHLTLRYPDLDPSSREQIWRQLSARAGPNTTLTEADFEHLKELPLNGRKIKNAVKNATMLAARQGNAVGIDQIRTVLAATQSVDVSRI